MFRFRHQLAATTGGRSRARRFFGVTAVAFIAAMGLPAQGFPQSEAVTVSERDGVYTVAATFSVLEAPAFVVAALTDYADIPRFMPDVRTSHVIDRNDDRAVVEQEAVARFMMFSKRVHLLLEVQEGTGTIRFRDRCGKSFVRYEGVWTVAERNGTTHVTYELAAQPSFDVPEFLLKRLFKRDAGQMIERLKNEIRIRASGK